MKKGVKENIIITGLTGATLLSGAFLTLPRVSAEPNTETVDRIMITVPPSCSLSTSVDNPTHTATVRNREYVDDIGETTIKAVCNDVNGFSVYAIGFSDDTYGKTVLSASTIDHANDIITGTATGPVGGNDVSNWAMRLSPVAGTYAPTIENGFDEYSEVPATYTKVATFTSRTDQSLGSSLKTNYAVYVSGTQLADTYTGKVKYTMVHPASEEPLQPKSTASGQICYYANASSALGTMGCQDVASEVTLLASNFSRTGYGFAGWSDKFDYATNANAKFYGPNETITLTPSDYQSPNKGLSLYAVWVKSAGSLQDQSKVAQLCGTNGTGGSLTTAPTDGTANLASISALTDQRDSQTYAIAKLADGQCWMIENLRLESTASHNTDGTLAQGYGTSTTYGNFSGLADAESTGFSSTYTANSLYYSGTQEGTASINIGTSNSPAYRMPRYNHENTNSRASNPTTNSNAMYSYGNYYTWHAAIADLTHNSTNNNSTTGTSLCPTGWRLPQGGDKTRIESNDDNDFWNLTVDALNGGTNPANYDSQTRPYYTGTDEAGPVANKLRSYPNNFLYSGGFSSSSADSRGSYGYYWSSTARYSNNSYYLYLYSSNVRPGTNSNNKNLGFSIRCVSSS